MTRTCVGHCSKPLLSLTVISKTPAVLAISLLCVLFAASICFSAQGSESQAESESFDSAGIKYKAIGSADDIHAKSPEKSAEQSGVMTPAEKAAERARAFRQSQSSGVGLAAGDDDASGESSSAQESDGEDLLETTVEIEAPVAPSGPLEFSDCVHLALRQSPFLVKSAMQIQLGRINESNSWWNMLPKLEMRTSYLLVDPNSDNRTTPLTNEDRWSLDFSLAAWDPVQAGLSVMAAQEVTKVAILAHMKVISNGLKDLGKLFISIGSLDQAILLQDEMIALAEHRVSFFKNLYDIGSLNPLELRIVEQERETAVLEREQLLAEKEEMFLNLKTFLGLDGNDPLELDLTDASNQVHGYFSPSEVSNATVRENSIDIKIMEQKRRMQEYQISIAWAQYIPRLKLDFRTPDTVDSEKQTSQGFYTTVGFEWVFWDWGERYRNVRQERLKTRQAIAEENITSTNTINEWRVTLNSKRRSMAALKVSRAQVELAGLNKRKSEIGYQAGTVQFPSYLNTIKGYFQARKRLLDSELRDDLVMLNLRYLSGDLFNAYVSARNL